MNEPNIDCVGEGNANFVTLHDLNLIECSFTNSQKFEDFLVSIESSMYLTRLHLYFPKFKEEAVIKQRLFDIIKTKPIQKLELLIYYHNATIVDMKTLDGLFDALSHRKLEHL